MKTNRYLTILARDDWEAVAGFRLRSWAMPLLITFTPNLYELAIGPFYIAHEKLRKFPF